MVIGLDRRRVLAAGVGAALGIAPQMSRAEDLARWAYLTPGFSVLLFKYMMTKKLLENNGVSLQPPQEYASVSTYYNDFSAGNYEVCFGSWDVFASRYQAGVPIQLLCTVTNAELIYIVTGEKDVKSVADLRGKTLAAPQSTGTYRLVSALVKARYGLEFGKDINIQGVDNPAASMTLVMANRAEGGLSWEPNISTAIKRRSDLRTIFNAGETYRELMKAELPYFGIAVSRDWAKRNPDKVKGLRRAYSQCLAGINADPDEAVKVVGSSTGFPPEAMAEAIKMKRLGLNYGDLSDPAQRENLLKAGQFMATSGLLPRPLDEGFFVPA
jgi:NitT/TauT family transport system substrate-binding protein